MRTIEGLVIALLFLAGCSSNPPVPTDSHMSISPHFSALEAEAAIDAAAQWHKATGGVVSLTPSIGDDGSILLYPGVVDGDTMGQTDSNGTIADIRINMEVLRAAATGTRHAETDLFRDTVMHELGHAFGLEHSSAGLMTSVGYGGGCIDRATLDAFCWRYSCPATAAPTCA